MWYCAKCSEPYDDDILPMAGIKIDDTLFCYGHASITTILDYANWRDAYKEIPKSWT